MHCWNDAFTVQRKYLIIIVSTMKCSFYYYLSSILKLLTLFNIISKEIVVIITIKLFCFKLYRNEANSQINREHEFFSTNPSDFYPRELNDCLLVLQFARITINSRLLIYTNILLFF